MSTPVLLRQASTLLRAVIAHITDDPVVFAMQVSRRLPARASRAAGRLLAPLPGPVARAASSWLGGDIDGARQYVRARAVSRRQARVLGEIALSLGDRRTAADAARVARSSAGDRLASRILWYEGRMTEAVETAPAGRLRDRLESERRTFQGDWRPTLRTESSAIPRHLPPTDVLFALTNSLPFTQSGYTLRTHAVLRAVRDAGVRTLAANRPGYPTTIGTLIRQDRARIDGIDYLFDVPARLGATQESRLDQQAVFLARVAQATGAQVIHTTTHFTNGLAAGAAARDAGLPWIYEVRGSLEDTWASSRGDQSDEAKARSSERFRRFRQREAQVASAADAVITLGHTMADELVSRGVDREKILVAPNSVGHDVLTSDWQADSATVREDIGLPRAGVWVGTAASIVGYEGLDVLVDAVIEARAGGADLRLLIAGDGVELPALRTRARGLGEAAVFTGRVPTARALRVIQALDVCVVPRRDVSVCRKITPLKPVEAAGLGRAVVLSDLPALREALPTGARRLVTAGSVTELAQVLVELAHDPDERSRLGADARSYVEANRTWSTVGAAYRSVYEGVGVSMSGGSA